MRMTEEEAGEVLYLKAPLEEFLHGRVGLAVCELRARDEVDVGLILRHAVHVTANQEGRGVRGERRGDGEWEGWSAVKYAG